MSEFEKIFNIGLNKCGTQSLAAALGLLGFKTAHFKHQGERLIDLIRSNHSASLKLFAGLEEYDAYLDFAGQYFFQEIDRQYPGSKFILTLRETSHWLDSRERHVRRNQQNPNYAHAFLKIDQAAWLEERRRTVEAVNLHFKQRPGDVLVIDIPAGEGWERLCPFLGRPIPSFPFPHANVDGGGVAR